MGCAWERREELGKKRGWRYHAGMPISANSTRLLIRISAAVMMVAAIAVYMPRAWMSAANDALRLAAMPTQPIFEYLARSASALYAIYGLLFWIMASDVRRYRPVLAAGAWSGVVFAVTIFCIDVHIGMPWRWTVCEGPMVMGLSVGLLALLRSVPNDWGSGR
jgi:hypothetical protein